MRTMMAIGVLVLAGSAPPATAWRGERGTDEAAIRETVQLYFDGGEKLRAAFHPDARMLYVRDGGLVQVPIEEFITRSIANARPAGTTDKTKKWVAAIDVTGNAATAKLEIVRADAVVTDYMSLLKVEGRWVIVNKIFDRTTTAAK